MVPIDFEISRLSARILRDLVRAERPEGVTVPVTYSATLARYSDGHTLAVVDAAIEVLRTFGHLVLFESCGLWFVSPTTDGIKSVQREKRISRMVENTAPQHWSQN